MEILNNYTPVAKKEHKCNYCSNTINIGEKYLYQFVVNCGEGYAWKSHLSCQEIALKLKMFDDCPDGLGECEFKDSIHQEYDNSIKTDEKTSFEHKLRFVKHKYLNQYA